MAEFMVQQGKEEEEHGKKTAKLQTQIDFLRKYDNASNKQKLTDLQFSLAKENSQYQLRNNERQAKYDADAEAEKLSYDTRLNENMLKLNEEKALLEKHAEDVKSVRGVMLLNEIESLKRSKDEQLKSLQQQKADAIREGAATGAQGGQAVADNYKNAINSIPDFAANVGNAAGGSLMDRMKSSFQRNWERNGGDFFKPMKDSLGDFWGLLTGSKKVVGGKIVGTGGGGGWATGGYTGRGGVNEPAGIVHRGEYVLPQSMVNQSTGKPKESVGGSSNVNISINMSGVMTGSPAEERNLARRLIDSLNQELTAKGKRAIGA